MTRHARNSTASAVYSYHERHKDTKTSGYGTQKARFGKDSIKDFDACNLTLQPCRNPVVTYVSYSFVISKILIHLNINLGQKVIYMIKNRF